MKYANSRANSSRGQGLGDAGVRQTAYQSLFDMASQLGIFGDDTFTRNPELKKLRDKYLTQKEGFEVFNDLEDGSFEMEDIADVIREIMGLLGESDWQRIENLI